MIRKSRFAYVFEEIGILWHSLTMKKLELDSNSLTALTAYADKKLEHSEWQKTLGDKLEILISQGFMVSGNIDEKILGDARNFVEKQQIQGLYLILTTACNLDCSYCLYRAQSSRSLLEIRNMSSETVKKSLELFSRRSKRNDRKGEYWEQITLYGGEPLLNRSCLKEALVHIETIKKEGKLWGDTSVVINTNGTLIDKSFARMIAEKGVEVQISIDSFQETHDKNRRTKSKKGSFDKVMRGLTELSKAGALFVPMITLNNDNMEEFPSFVEWLCKNVGIRRYGTNLLMSTTEREETSYPKKAAASMIEADRIAKRFGASDENFTGTVGGFLHPGIAKQSCGAGRKITIFPNGEVHTCQALEGSRITYLGKDLKFRHNDPIWLEWRTRSRFGDESCLSCPILGACGGGCAAGSYHTNSSIKTIDPNYCRWIKELFKQWLYSEI